MNAKLFVLAGAVLFSSIAVAQDAPEKKRKRNPQGGNNVGAALMKQLAEVGLTDEQKTKIQALAKKSMEEMRAARKEAGIDAELMKKRTAASKELKESGTKGKDLEAAVNKKTGTTEAQAAVFKKTAGMRAALLKGAVALLSDEQKAKLPARMTQGPGGKKGAAGKGKGKGKKKKKDADE